MCGVCDMYLMDSNYFLCETVNVVFCYFVCSAGISQSGTLVLILGDWSVVVKILEML